MALIKKIHVKDFNPDKLREELEAAGGGFVQSTVWAGFDSVSDRLYTPMQARRAVGSSSVNGVQTIDYADPGELRFVTPRDITPAEDDGLETILVAHNAATLSQAQIEADADEDVFDALIAEKKPIYVGHLNNWDTYTNTQRTAATKEMFEIVADVMNLFLKTYPAAQ